MSRRAAGALLCALALVAAPAAARLTEINVASVERFANGARFGETGAYERVRGTFKGELDPADPRNRVIVNLDFQPSGMFEKMASGMRFVKRAAKSDVYRYKAFIEMQELETGAWRGVIEDGEVVEPHDESYDEERDYSDVEDLQEQFGSSEDSESSSDADDGDDGDDDEKDEEPVPVEELPRDKTGRFTKGAGARARNGNGGKQEAKQAASSRSSSSRSANGNGNGSKSSSKSSGSGTRRASSSSRSRGASNGSGGSSQKKRSTSSSSSRRRSGSSRS